MIFDARVQPVANAHFVCTQTGSLLIPADKKTKEITFIFGAGTNYDQRNGNTASNYSFKGVDPEAAVLSNLQAAGKKPYADIYSAHVKDYHDLFSGFNLNLPDPNYSEIIPTAQLINQYTTEAGDPWVESLLFDYGRYLFIASSRPGTLPPSLAGIWTEQLFPPWGADYHPDLNLQM
jgi:alpha-L-fucosidase 2